MLHEKLAGVNLLVRYNQWVYVPKVPCPFLDKLEDDPKEYTNKSSFIYYADTGAVDIDVKAGVPQAVISYKIYFNVSDSQQQLKCGQRPHEYMEQIELYTAFAKYSPCELTITRCNGDKCRRNIAASETGVWCISCHGEFDSTSCVWSLLGSFKFSDIPKASILYLEEIRTPISPEDKKQAEFIRVFIEEEKQHIAKIEEDVKEGGRFDQQIQEFIKHMTETRREVMTKCNQLKAKYGI